MDQCNPGSDWAAERVRVDDGQEEVGDLKNEIAKLKNAIQRINDCDYRGSEIEVGCFLGETLGAFGFQGLFLFVIFFGIVDKLVGWNFG